MEDYWETKVAQVTLTEFLKNLYDADEAKRLSVAQDLKRAGFLRGTPSGKLESFLELQNAIIDAEKELAQLKPVSGEIDRLTYYATRRKSDTFAGGAAGTPPITDYPVVSSPTDAKRAINAVYQESLGRDATAAEVKLLYPVLKKAQLENPTTYKETTINGKKTRIQYTALDTNQFILDQINKNPVTKQELAGRKEQAPELTARIAEKKIYDDLIKKAKGDKSKIDLAKTNTAYGRGVESTLAALAEYAISTGAEIADDELRSLATQVYDQAIENDPVQLRNLVRGSIGATGKGKAGDNYAVLQQVAAANGLDLDKTFGPNIDEWLQKIDKGESIDTYKRLIRSTAKIGMPQNVATLLDNGVDLEAVYSPYKNLMAATLEINPDTITLNDPVLRSAVTGDKEVPLYEFQRQLRKDSRWQYTNQARQEVSDVALKVLRDFGFQG